MSGASIFNRHLKYDRWQLLDYNCSFKIESPPHQILERRKETEGEPNWSWRWIGYSWKMASPRGTETAWSTPALSQGNQEPKLCNRHGGSRAKSWLQSAFALFWNEWPSVRGWIHPAIFGSSSGSQAFYSTSGTSRVRNMLVSDTTASGPNTFFQGRRGKSCIYWMVKKEKFSIGEPRQFP